MLRCNTILHRANSGRERPQQVFGNVIKVRLPFSLRQRLRDFAGVLDEKLRDGAERAVPHGDDTDWYAGQLKFNGQDPELG
ncbi:MAG TPA: hypothetical protein VK148_30085, partial [Xanthobacteraceae bacterium]|nr:hypothetical protein [Xanthobacteraceae bacterium]